MILLYWRTVLDTEHGMYVYLFCTDFPVCQHSATFKYPYHGRINIMPVIYIFNVFAFILVHVLVLILHPQHEQCILMLIYCCRVSDAFSHHPSTIPIYAWTVNAVLLWIKHRFRINFWTAIVGAESLWVRFEKFNHIELSGCYCILIHKWQARAVAGNSEYENKYQNLVFSHCATFVNSLFKSQLQAIWFNWWN